VERRVRRLAMRGQADEAEAIFCWFAEQNSPIVVD
jgi:hypothetical protein